MSALDVRLGGPDDLFFFLGADYLGYRGVCRRGDYRFIRGMMKNLNIFRLYDETDLKAVRDVAATLEDALYFLRKEETALAQAEIASCVALNPSRWPGFKVEGDERFDAVWEAKHQSSGATVQVAWKSGSGWKGTVTYNGVRLGFDAHPTCLETAVSATLRGFAEYLVERIRNVEDYRCEILDAANRIGR